MINLDLSERITVAAIDLRLRGKNVNLTWMNEYTRDSDCLKKWLLAAIHLWQALKARCSSIHTEQWEWESNCVVSHREYLGVLRRPVVATLVLPRNLERFLLLVDPLQTFHLRNTQTAITSERERQERWGEWRQRLCEEASLSCQCCHDIVSTSRVRRWRRAEEALWLALVSLITAASDFVTTERSSMTSAFTY